MLTVIANAVASIVVPEPSGDREPVRRNKRNICAGPTACAGGVLERCFEHRAVLAIESACACLQVRNGSDKGAVANIVSTGRENAATLDEGRLG
jgi:hypothetical protein